MSNKPLKHSEIRAGRKNDRSKRVGSRMPELGYYLVVTDTKETEKNYFNGLRDAIPEEFKDRIVIKIRKTDTYKLVDYALELMSQSTQYRMLWIVFDRDQVKDFDVIIDEAERNGINAGWSNPCIEAWMYGYFDNTPMMVESWDCCEKFARKYQSVTGQEYFKDDCNIYCKLIDYGDEVEAIKRARRRLDECERDGVRMPSKMYSATTVCELVGEIREKVGYK